MCGINGILSKELIDPKIVKEMTCSLIHRGPHSEGFFDDDGVSLGMRRLEVIDLETGNQPIFNEDKSIVAVYNGEIYNFESLRDDLKKKNHTFTTKTDTEILVHGYEEWGIDELLSRLNGMFAFCIYDKNRKKIYLSRDRLGEKPFYYFYNDTDFIFGSELQTILESQKIPIEISKLALYCYLGVHFVPGDLCIIKGVKKLLPGHYIEFDLDKFSLKQIEYWDLKERNFHLKNYDECVQYVKKLVEDSIQLRMISDVPLGVFLSGGVDSSIITIVMKKYAKEVQSFSVGFEDKKFDESKYSKLISQKYETSHNHFILRPEKISEILPKVVRCMDEPCGDQALLPVFWLSHEAKKHVTVVLGGEGGDEIFGGYSYYNSPNSSNHNFQDTDDQELLPSFFRKVPETQSGFPTITDFKMRSKLIKNFDYAKLKNELNNYIWWKNLENNLTQIQDNLRREQYVDIKTWLPDDLLMKFDKMSMANSLEGRSPFLDYRLVEFAFNLSSEYKIKGNTFKLILRDAFKDILPKEIFERDKQGFNLPMSKWLKTSLKAMLKETISLNLNDGIDNEYLQTIAEEHLSGKEDRGRLLYSILIYKLWIKNLIERFVN